MIKAILLDFGGVYIASPFVAIAEIAADMQVSADVLQRITFGDYDSDNDHPWHCLERGEISLEKARELILLEGRKQGLDTDIYAMLARFSGVERSISRPLVDKTLEWKSRGYQLGMITNNIREFNGWRNIFPFVLDDVFDVVVDSSVLGIRKPDSGIFRYALDVLQLGPEQALFLDDYPGNIAAASALGIQGYTVAGPIENAIAWIEEQLR